MYAEYIRILTEMVLEFGRTPVVWEGFAKQYNEKISKDVIVMCFEYMYQTAEELSKAGFTLINASWVPLYIITGMKRFDRAPEEILEWNPWTWRNWFEKSLAYPGPVTIDKETSNVIGGQLCAWGDGLKDMENWESGLDDELNNIKQKLPLLCKKLINVC